MEYLIGTLLAVAALGMATVVGLGRDRAFYPTVMMPIATYYVLFAVMGASGNTLFLECGAAALFILIAVVGFRTSLWLVVVALAGHGVFDLFHHLLIANPGVPDWWPGFCGAFDVVAGVFLAIQLKKQPRFSLRVDRPTVPIRQ